jgi:predicted RNA-binding protein with PIN domain
MLEKPAAETAMEIIIDGYNLLALDRRLDRALEQGRSWLIGRLAKYHEVKPNKITVVFDGWRFGRATEAAETVRGLTVVYSKLGEKADAVIIRLARQRGSGSVVVSSDREIRSAVERYDVTAIYANEFNEILDGLDGDSVPVDDWYDGGEGDRRDRRHSKSERRRQEKLRKLRL